MWVEQYFHGINPADCANTYLLIYNGHKCLKSKGRHKSEAELNHWPSDDMSDALTIELPDPWWSHIFKHLY